MSGKTEEDEIEVEDDAREDPDGDAVHPEDHGDEDDEEDEEGEDEYEKDGFIVDDVSEDEEDAEEEDRGESDDERQLKKKRKKRESEKNYVLDDDDYELLKENNITGFKRPKVESKRFKRLKKAWAEADEGQSGFSDEGPPIEKIVEEDQVEEDEMADFIVDEEEVNENREPTRRRRKVNKKKSREGHGVSSVAMQEARDIFGDVVELLRQRKLVLERIHRCDDSGEGKELEPTILSTKYKTEKDQCIRGIDMPERMQISEESTSHPTMGEMSMEEEGTRILHQFKKVISIQKNWYQAKTMDNYRYADRDNSESGKEKALKTKARARKHLKSRMIVHPRFRNITADEAIKMLNEKDPGECIVRPSSRGLSYLTLTIKIYDGVYAHKDIIEGGKENKDSIRMLCIGKTLKIGEDVFEDLDEVMDRYVDPLRSHLKKMLDHRKFKDGGKTEVGESLRKEKLENPSRIVYAFGISHEHPGTFILSYIRNSNLHHENVGLYPKGFKFRNKMFEEIDRLVAYFQRHMDDPQNAGLSVRSVAAMLPMRSPAGGSCGGGSYNNGGDAGEARRLKI